MDSNFWASILIGSLLSIPLSIISNLYSDRVRIYLLFWKEVRLSRKLAREQKRHALVTALRSGDPAATLKFQIDNHEATRQMLMGITLVVAVGVMAVFSRQIEHVIPIWILRIYALCAAFAGNFLVINAIIFHWHARLTGRRIVQFDKYTRRIRARWGEDAV